MADVPVRRASAEGFPLPWVAASLPGGLVGQRAAEGDLRREGLDRAALGREAFVARMSTLADLGQRQLSSVVAALGLDLDMNAAVIAGETVARAARTAFVRLFDAGVPVEADSVVGACPACATAVAQADAVPVDVDGEALTLRLALVDRPPGAADRIEVRCFAPELLPGLVAVAVPDASPLGGSAVVAPVVPFVAYASWAAPSSALALLAAAVGQGVPTSDDLRVHAQAAPFLGA